MGGDETRLVRQLDELEPQLFRRAVLVLPRVALEGDDPVPDERRRPLLQVEKFGGEAEVDHRVSLTDDHGPGRATTPGGPARGRIASGG